MLEENTQPQVEEEVTETSEATQNVEPMQTFKVKHLHEEKEIPYDEAPTYIQKGLDYDRIKSKYESSKSTLDFVENLARQQGMTVDDYIKAVNEHNEQERVREIADKYSMDPELAEELYLLRKERQEKAVREQEYQAKERENQDYMNFFKQFPDVKVEEIPQEVFQLRANNPGMSLVDAYIRHDYEQLKNKINTQKVNAQNSEATTGSIAGNEAIKGDFISQDAFEKNRHDKTWVRKNYEKLIKSRPKW